ncbi:MAG: hypothetical protein QOH57_3012 [Mycobacterium sp.]|nr:hypothetical protein [Mycobacterium sp.]
MERLAAVGFTGPMTTNPLLIATTAASITSAAVGGVFYAFSAFVMRGLDRTGPLDAITAMRGINAEAERNAPLLVLLFGSALLALVAGVVAAAQWRQAGSGFVIAGAVCALAAVVVTIAFNVPLNNHLAGVDPTALSLTEAAHEWQSYLSSWTAYNHVRTGAPLLGSVLLLTGLRLRG